jgi:uncharacterized protein (TIGR03118 family)
VPARLRWSQWGEIVLSNKQYLGVGISLLALALESCGGSGYNASMTLNEPMPAVTLSATPSTITSGQSATLNWSSTNATSCTASGAWSGTEATSGSLVVTPTATATYKLSCAGPSGAGYSGGGGLVGMQSVTLTVNPATAFVVTALVADGAGVAAKQDTNLVNAWGLVFGTNAPVWTSNNASNTSSLYEGDGTNLGLLVSLPTSFAPTGIVWFNAAANTTDFVVSESGKSGPSSFIYSGKSGMIAGWNPTVDLLHAVTAYTASDKACYTGLAIASNGTANFLYATDFAGAKIDVFDTAFAKQNSSAFPFTDPHLPQNYAPYGIQAIGNGTNGATQIYVTYAKVGSACTATAGAGLGLVAVFDANGKFLSEVVPAGGLLNEPWGVTLSPANFGTLSNALLISNHGDGRINGYDPASGTFLGTLQTSSGAYTQDGLWGISMGNNGMAALQPGQPATDLHQPANTLFLTAGPNSGASGLYARIDVPTM